ncbi:unnamed protein product [Kuraishia capsulata CBS 1993]|uniref:NADPH:adrenodoxin oxidoreductase, mitochondrial n=1 Tax=Kuraishia capsulata CBS 1993 TaxID=1382522 RepID=W6MU05_9ASCO|nr:uncharacterized protein KUCA_T00004777001 [Kuraishia capsulata CBS 1993]CDK28792.1 unnamed protein product [Kuraishia capsulata CBS 1993]
MLLQSALIRQNLWRAFSPITHRPLSTSAPSVAIVGSGPSGFYTAVKLLTTNNDANMEIDMFERLPVPYGLSRYGVAPDHPEVKNCQKRFDEITEDPRFKFYGNVEIGKDLKLHHLVENYNAVVLAYGCADGSQLGIEGEDHPAVFNSKEFVGWYNGDPEHVGLDPPLEKAKTVTIIGNGNVSLDLVRVLLGPVDKLWSQTDMAQHAISKLRKSTIEHVNIVGRRGFVEAAFTNKEFKELLEMQKDGVAFTNWSEDMLPPTFREFSKLFSRAVRRRLDLVDKYTASPYSDYPKHKSWGFEFLKSPKKFVASESDPNLLKETIFEKNKLVQTDANYPVTIVGSGQLVSLENEIVINSTGYRGRPFEEFEKLNIPWDSSKSRIPNLDGRVLSTGSIAKGENYEFIQGLYTTGWAGTGPKGNINTSLMEANVTSTSLLDDFEKGILPARKSFQGRKATDFYLQKKPDVVTWDMWKAIESAENELGKMNNKLREKIVDVDSMIDIATK